MQMINFNSFSDFNKLCDIYKLQKIPKLERDKPVWIFGAGNFAQDICNIIKQENFDFKGFIVSSATQNEVLGFPVKNLSEFNLDGEDLQLVFGVLNREAKFNVIENDIKQRGFSKILMPWHVYTQFESSLGWRYWLSNPNTILNSLFKIQKTYDLLDDDVSKQCLLNICAFRLAVNQDYASFMHLENQYFNQITLPFFNNKSIKYVDMGAYNGDTVIELSQKVDNLTDAYLFEPDIDNFNDLVSAVDKSEINTLCLPLGVSDKSEILSFSTGCGEGSAISDNGNVHIATVALDDFLIKHDVNFIKMDIEGAEILAIKGAKKTIKRCRPVLAISYYHKPGDIWEIPLLLQQYCKSYKFYLRQHYYNSFESVLYAIPVN